MSKRKIYITSFLIIILFSVIVGNLYSQETKILGIAPSYKNETIKFYKYSDNITKLEEELFTVKIDSSGKFSHVFNLPQTTFAFSYIGVFRCVFYIESGKDLWLNFPKKTTKSIEDILNPYFKVTDFFIGMNDTMLSDLNYSIKTFDDEIDEYLNSNFFNIYRKARKFDIDSIIATIEIKYNKSENIYFNDYRKYKYAYLQNIAYIRNQNFATKEFFTNQPILYYNNAYMDFFNMLFSNFLSLYAVSKEGSEITNDIVLAKSIFYLKNTLQKNIAFQDEKLQELIVLKGIHDAFFVKKTGEYKLFPSKQLFQVLDSISIISKQPEHKLIAKNIQKKVLNLHNGTDAPYFELNDIKNKKYKLSDTDNKYLYISFIHSKSMACQEELILVKELYKKYKKEIKFISIAFDENFNEAIKLFEAQKYEWTLLNGSENIELLKTYNIKAFPTYYFFSKDLKLINSPAQSPKENFELIFLKNYKSKDYNSPKDYDELFKQP